MTSLTEQRISFKPEVQESNLMAGEKKIFLPYQVPKSDLFTHSKGALIKKTS